MLFRSAALRAVLKPVLMLGKPVLVIIDKAALALFWPFWKMLALLKSLFSGKAA